MGKRRLLSSRPVPDEKRTFRGRFEYRGYTRFRFSTFRQMADIELTRSHSMRLDEARTAVERVAQQLETDLEVDYEWDGDTLLFDGPGADGRIEIETDAIQVLIDLSAFLRPMKDRVESEAETYLDRSLDDAAS